MGIPDLSPPKTRQEAIEQARNMIAFWNRRIAEASFSKKWGSAGHSNELPSPDEMQRQLNRWQNELKAQLGQDGWNVGNFLPRDY